MNAREYAPGTVAVATVNGVRNVHMMRGTTYWWAVADNSNGGRLLDADDVTDVRPLVVLDFFDPASTAFVVDVLRQPRHSWTNLIADQIEAQTRPPKPAEPTGLGAVVEDAEGRRWTRARSHDHGLNWREEWGGRWTTWADLDAVRVLSEGVTA